MDSLRTIGMTRAAWAALPAEMKRMQDGVREVLDPDTGERVAFVHLSRQPGDPPDGAWRSPKRQGGS